MSAAASSHRQVANLPLLVVSIMLATLMQVIDTTIANVALPDMQGALSATQDQVSWVLTSYIVAAAIATPATGWLAAKLGRRRLLAIAIGGFTVASMLCAVAADIGQMVAFRVLQGLFGAALVPISQSTLLDVFPKEKHGAAMAMWGMGVMIGPILGPPLEGRRAFQISALRPDCNHEVMRQLVVWLDHLIEEAWRSVPVSTIRPVKEKVTT